MGTPPHAATCSRPAMRLRLIEQVGLRQITEPVVLPPRRLVLTAVPVEQIREEPARMLLVIRAVRLPAEGPRAAARGRPAGAPPARRPSRSPRHLSVSAAARRALRHRAPRAGAPASRAAPRWTGSRPVVRLHRGARFVRNGRRRVRPPAPARSPAGARHVSERQRAREAVELLQLLDRVALHSRPKRLTDDAYRSTKRSPRRSSSSCSARVA